MAILAQCPECKRKQSNKKKKCPACGCDIDAAKKSKRVIYHVRRKLPEGKQVQESVGYNIEKAHEKDREWKNKILAARYSSHKLTASGLKGDSVKHDMTFTKLIQWYLKLDSVEQLKSYVRICGCLKRFSEYFGNDLVIGIVQVDLENYQIKRKKDGVSPRTIDYEISTAKTMITKACDNDKIPEKALKPFRVTKKLLKKGANARTRVLTIQEYFSLIKHSPLHIKNIIKIAFNTGMRQGELTGLRWEYIDLKSNIITLPADVVKEDREKKIPINKYVKKVLENIPRVLHHDFVITYKNKNIKSPAGVKKGFQAACIRAGIPYGQKVDKGVTFHDIRRTVKTNMVKAGVEKTYRDSILGHAPQGMDIYYIVPDDKSRAKAMIKYTNWLSSEFNRGDQMGDQAKNF